MSTRTIDTDAIRARLLGPVPESLGDDEVLELAEELDRRRDAAKAALLWLRNKGARLFVRDDGRGYDLVRELRAGLSRLLDVENPEG